MNLLTHLLQLFHLGPKPPVLPPRPPAPGSVPVVPPTVPAPQPAPVVAAASLPALRVGVGSHGSPDEARQLASLGTLTRITYSAVDRAARGEQYDAEFAARLVDLRTHGLDVLVVVHDFFSKMPYDQIVPLMASLAKRHPGTAFQIFNEADAQPWYRGGDCAGLMAALLPAMKAADSTCSVVGMGLACTDGQSWAFMADGVRQPLFLTEYLKANGPTLDAWCIHVYQMPLAKRVTQLVQATQSVLQGRMPLWITECGMDDVTLQANGITVGFDAMQSAEIVGAREAAAKVGAARLYIYNLWTNDETGFGVLRADATTERPVCAAWRVVA